MIYATAVACLPACLAQPAHAVDFQCKDGEDMSCSLTSCTCSSSSSVGAVNPSSVRAVNRKLFGTGNPNPGGFRKLQSTVEINGKVFECKDGEDMSCSLAGCACSPPSSVRAVNRKLQFTNNKNSKVTVECNGKVLECKDGDDTCTCSSSYSSSSVPIGLEIVGGIMALLLVSAIALFVYRKFSSN